MATTEEILTWAAGGGEIPTEADVHNCLAELTAGEMNESILSQLQFLYEDALHLWLPIRVGTRVPDEDLKPAIELYRCLKDGESEPPQDHPIHENPFPIVMGIWVQTGSPDGQRILPVAPIGPIEVVHERWMTWPDPRPEHPLIPLMKAWQEWKALQPHDVQRNGRPDRLFPSSLAMCNANDHRAGRRFTPAMHLRSAEDGDQLIMPGFSSYVEDLATPALPLIFYDLGIGAGVERRGRGAPVPLRIWMESILSVSQADRLIYGPVGFNVPMGEFLEAIWPQPEIGGRGLPRPNMYVPLLDQVSDILASKEARFPYVDQETGVPQARSLVLLGDFPREGGKTALREGKVQIIVNLPPGAVDGPIMSPRLATWGITSAPHYRALIGLGFRWWDPGKTHIPVGKGKNRRWLRSKNPKAYGERMTDADAVALCFPTSTRKQRRKLIPEAWEVLGGLVATGEAREEDGRLMPPTKLPRIPKRGAKVLRFLLNRYRERARQTHL